MNIVTFGVHEGLCHIVIFIKGYVALQCSSSVMLHCDISEELCCISIIPKLWHINNVTLQVQQNSSYNVNYGHIVLNSRMDY